MVDQNIEQINTKRIEELEKNNGNPMKHIDPKSYDLPELEPEKYMSMTNIVKTFKNKTKTVQGGFGWLIDYHMEGAALKKLNRENEGDGSWSIDSNDEKDYLAEIDSYLFMENIVKKCTNKLFYEYIKNDELYYKINRLKIKVRLLKSCCSNWKQKFTKEQARSGLIQATYNQFTILHKACDNGKQMEKLETQTNWAVEAKNLTAVQDVKGDAKGGKKGTQPGKVVFTEQQKQKFNEDVIEQIKQFNQAHAKDQDIKLVFDAKRSAKTISQIFDERSKESAIYCTKENYDKTNLQRFSFDYFLERQPSILIAEKKYREFILGTSQLKDSSPRFKLYNMLMDFTDELYGHSDETFIFNIWRHIKSSKVGINVYELMTDECTLIPYIRVLDYIKKYVQEDLTEKVFNLLIDELNENKIDNNVNRDGMIDLDLSITILLRNRRINKNDEIQYISTLFAACDLNKKNVIEMYQFEILIRSIEKVNNCYKMELHRESFRNYSENKLHMNLNSFLGMCTCRNQFSRQKIQKFCFIKEENHKVIHESFLQIKRMFDDFHEQFNKRIETCHLTPKNRKDELKKNLDEIWFLQSQTPKKKDSPSLLEISIMEKESIIDPNQKQALEDLKGILMVRLIDNELSELEFNQESNKFFGDQPTKLIYEDKSIQVSLKDIKTLHSKKYNSKKSYGNKSPDSISRSAKSHKNKSPHMSNTLSIPENGLDKKKSLFVPVKEQLKAEEKQSSSNLSREMSSRGSKSPSNQGLSIHTTIKSTKKIKSTRKIKQPLKRQKTKLSKKKQINRINSPTARVFQDNQSYDSNDSPRQIKNYENIGLQTPKSVSLPVTFAVSSKMMKNKTHGLQDLHEIPEQVSTIIRNSAHSIKSSESPQKKDIYSARSQTSSKHQSFIMESSTSHRKKKVRKSKLQNKKKKTKDKKKDQVKHDDKEKVEASPLKIEIEEIPIKVSGKKILVSGDSYVCSLGTDESNLDLREPEQKIEDDRKILEEKNITKLIEEKNITKLNKKGNPNRKLTVKNFKIDKLEAWERSNSRSMSDQSRDSLDEERKVSKKKKKSKSTGANFKLFKKTRDVKNNILQIAKKQPEELDQRIVIIAKHDSVQTKNITLAITSKNQETQTPEITSDINNNSKSTSKLNTQQQINK